MSRGNLMIVVFLSAALAGMFFWTLSIQSRQSELSASMGPGSLAGERDDREIRSLRQEMERQDVEIASLRTQVARLDREVEEARTAAGGMSAAAPAPAVPTDVASRPAAPTELKETIEEVLDEREAKERQERYERMARGMSRFLLNGIDATEEQQDRFVSVITTYMTGREQIREEYGEGEDQARDDALRRLDEQRNAELQQIFGATELEQIRERMERGRRAFEGGRGGPGGRTGGRGGAPGGGGR